ncbi:unnamed protein product [Enterobius vermicularis]|uniref:Sulfate_transp domain-containing protein n=1 Tax=Enterobius vermicularis TaxID=51028 RepID=A0A0N4VJU9_ENTVE|nr:unnamed protein product [Enterobius vermicularis]
MHIPQGIAYARLSGVDPVYGLYSSFFPPLFYMFFGSSRHCSIGSFAVISLMSGIANDQVMSKYVPTVDDNDGLNNSTVRATGSGNITPIEVAATLTFALGILQLVAGLLRLEFLTTYFSDQLVAGYTTGSAVHVIIGQVNEVLGIKIPKSTGPGYLFRTVYNIIVRLPQTNVFTLIVSLLSMLLLYVGKTYINPLVGKCLPLKIPIPYEIILIVIGAAFSYIFNFNQLYGTKIVGNVPSGQEFYALGFTSVLSGLFPVYPTGTALGRTMVNVESGAKTLLSTVFSCILLLVSILWLGPLLQPLPMCVLSAIIIMALKSMLWKVTELKDLWPVSKIDFYIWLFSFVITIAVDVMEGLALSILFALLTVIFRFQW